MSSPAGNRPSFPTEQGDGLAARLVPSVSHDLQEIVSGRQRNAAASAIIDGVDVTRDFLFATLSTNLYGSTTICLRRLLRT